ncbi:MAG: hypothetical protein ABI650_07905 [Dokdonella sp.]
MRVPRARPVAIEPHADATFASRTDGSTVELKDGEIISTWVHVEGRIAVTDPRRLRTGQRVERILLGAHRCAAITVASRSTDAEGKPQSHAIVLRVVRR